MAKKKAIKKTAAIDSGVCSNCWRYSAFKDECMYFWENKNECSKFLRHQYDEEQYERKRFLD